MLYRGIVFLSFLCIVAAEFRCSKLSRNYEDIFDFIFDPDTPSETEICYGVKICHSTWIQEDSRIILLRQGCGVSENGTTEFSHECGSDTCSSFFTAETDALCPIGPQAVCCCDQPMCNANVVPYSIPCLMSPPHSKSTNATSTDHRKENSFDVTHFVIVVVSGILLVGCAIVFFVFLCKDTIRRIRSPRNSIEHTYLPQIVHKKVTCRLCNIVCSITSLHRHCQVPRHELGIALTEIQPQVTDSEYHRQPANHEHECRVDLSKTDIT